jgi:hypothetical protein
MNLAFFLDFLAQLYRSSEKYWNHRCLVIVCSFSRCKFF